MRKQLKKSLSRIASHSTSWPEVFCPQPRWLRGTVEQEMHCPFILLIQGIMEGVATTWVTVVIVLRSIHTYQWRYACGQSLERELGN